MLHAVGIFPQLPSQLAQPQFQQIGVGHGQLPDGAHPQTGQCPLGGSAHIQQIAHRLGPHHPHHILPGNHRGGVRFFVVRAQFGKDFIEGYPHRDGQAGLLPHFLPQTVGNGPAITEQSYAAGDIQPAFINAKGLHLLGVTGVDGVDDLGPVGIFLMMGRHQHQIGALLFGLPDGLGGFHSKALCQLIFCQNDTMAALRVAADRHGNRLQFGALELLHRSIKAVAVTMQNDGIAHRTWICPSTLPMGSRMHRVARPS